jgi:class 3 adenylate cyclase
LRESEFAAESGRVQGEPETHIARSADGTSLAYLVSGDGPLDILFGSAGAPVELLWDDPGFARIAKRLATFSRTFWLDPRGWGGSEGDQRESLVWEISDADIQAVLDAEGIERAALVGWSTPGNREIHFSATHPERVSALILIDSCAHYVREDDYPIGLPRERLDRAVASLRESWATGSDLEVNAPRRLADQRFRAWWARARRASFGPNRYLDGFREGVEWDSRPLLSSISAPTLVLHREGDRFIRLGAGRYLAENIPGAKLLVLPGDDHLFFVGDTDALVDEIEDFLTGARGRAEGDVVLATLLFTDIVASTEQSARMGHRKWTALTDAHDAMVRGTLGRHRGVEVKTVGDGFLATFDTTTRAVRAATEIVAAAENMGLKVRAGVHTGEVEVRSDDVVGLPVSIAKRICDLARPGETLVSATVKALMVGSDIATVDRGTHVLKGVPDEWHLFAAAVQKSS